MHQNKNAPHDFLTHIKETLRDRPEYLYQAVDTEEASRITGVPVATLVSMRSRGGGPVFVQPLGTRLVRYLRINLFEWLLSGGLRTSTSDLPVEPQEELPR